MGLDLFGWCSEVGLRALRAGLRLRAVRGAARQWCVTALRWAFALGVRAFGVERWRVRRWRVGRWALGRWALVCRALACWAFGVGRVGRWRVGRSGVGVLGVGVSGVRRLALGRWHCVWEKSPPSGGAGTERAPPAVFGSEANKTAWWGSRRTHECRGGDEGRTKVAPPE